MRVLIVDDHPVVLSGCKALLAGEDDIEVIEAANAEDGFAAFFAGEADVALVDINLPGVSGFELTQKILAKKPDARIVIFSMNDDPAFVARAIQEGAKGYIPKCDDPLLFAPALRQVAAGGTYLPHALAQKLAFSVPENPPGGGLSAREVEILRLLAAGCDIAAIAEKLDVSTKTIANNCSLLKAKLGVRSSMDLLRAAMERVR
jgi:DNA-binding NarL/FixJ family response regulator